MPHQCNATRQCNATCQRNAPCQRNTPRQRAQDVTCGATPNEDMAASNGDATMPNEDAPPPNAGTRNHTPAPAVWKIKTSSIRKREITPLPAFERSHDQLRN
ncbi:hypothetical protein BS47DRAFT_1401851 [Hydnum rufescens UP504]|uniref:Uncharacterized protein n=1 Tax=Hydnum rufescens UP504 TaxID=1448309 RepID=A0A9P6AE10_9AGAM|nr:hypothetical protein BS47DRAFT_1401851 [Hydnum rufescens UP504]